MPSRTWLARTGTFGWVIGATTGPIIRHMLQSLGNTLRIALDRRGAAGDSSLVADAVPARRNRIVEFVAYGEDCLLSGRLRMDTDRLSDMLNAHDEFLITDVLLERLQDGRSTEISEILIPRDEVMLVHAAGPRGSAERRRRTRAHPVALQLGDYQVRGYLHALPGADAINAIRRRPTMVPLTDAWIEYDSGGIHHRRGVGAVVVNRDHIEWIVPTKDEEVEMPDLPLDFDRGPMLKDFTGFLFRAS